MANSGMSKERAALEATRARLEAALAADENWRALRRARTHGDAEGSDESRARDARLELLLVANPLFRAWKHVDDAIEDLTRNEAQAEPGRGPRTLAAALPRMGGNAPKQIASLADLSQGIARLLQRDLPDAGREVEIEEAPYSEVQDASAPAPVAAAGPQAETEVELEAGTVMPDGPAKGAASPAETMPSPAAGPRKADRAAPADLPWMVSAGRVRAGSEPPPGFSVEIEEATVTFVARGPAPVRRSMPPAADAGSEGRPEASGQDLAFHPLGADIEEAEVTILSGKDLAAHEQTAKRDGNLRRFRKALKGD